MLERQKLDQWLNQRSLVILDGAMGTELERRGYRTQLPLWSAMANIEAPQLVHEIHTAYIHAGCDVITANTFRTTRHTFGKAGKLELAAHCMSLAVELAREAISQANPNVLLAGSIAPLEDCYSPELVPSDHDIEAAYSHEIAGLSGTGIDFILVETMINCSEARIAAQLLHASQIPFMISFTTDEAGHLLDGTPIEKAVEIVDPNGPSAILLNCRPAHLLHGTLQRLRRSYAGVTGVYANGGGNPDPDIGWQLAEGSTADYVRDAKTWHVSGAKIIGGCCGTTPEMMRAVRDALITRSGQQGGQGQ